MTPQTRVLALGAAAVVAGVIALGMAGVQVYRGGWGRDGVARRASARAWMVFLPASCAVIGLAFVAAGAWAACHHDRVAAWPDELLVSVGGETCFRGGPSGAEDLVLANMVERVLLRQVNEGAHRAYLRRQWRTMSDSKSPFSVFEKNEVVRIGLVRVEPPHLSSQRALRVRVEQDGQLLTIVRWSRHFAPIDEPPSASGVQGGETVLLELDQPVRLVLEEYHANGGWREVISTDFNVR